MHTQDVCDGLDESIHKEMQCNLMLIQCSESLDTLQEEVLMSSHTKVQKSKLDTLKVRMHLYFNFTRNKTNNNTMCRHTYIYTGSYTCKQTYMCYVIGLVSSSE